MASYKAFAFLSFAYFIVLIVACFIKEDLRRLNYKKQNVSDEVQEAGYYAEERREE